MLRSEVLPAPLGPMTDTISPLRTAKDTSSTAQTPPKCLETATAESCAAPVPPLALATVGLMAPVFLPRLVMHSRCACHDARAGVEVQLGSGVLGRVLIARLDSGQGEPLIAAGSHLVAFLAVFRGATGISHEGALVSPGDVLVDPGHP